MTPTRGANARVVGKVLAFSGVFMMAAALAARLRWLPYSEPASHALAMIFAATAAVDLIIAMVLLIRYRP